MKSEMHESVSSLAPVDYEPYLKLLQEVVEQSSSLFTFVPHALQIQSADLAFQVANEFEKREGTRKELAPLFPYSLGTRMVTIHLAVLHHPLDCQRTAATRCLVFGES